MIDQITLLWKPVVEIVIIWAILYHILKFLQGTRGFRILGGVVLIYVGVFGVAFIASRLHLYVVHYVLLVGLLPISLVALIVVFQPELRRGLIRVSENPLLKTLLKTEVTTIDAIMGAVVEMSK